MDFKQIGTTPFGKITLGFFFHLLGQAVVAVTGNQIAQALVCMVGWLYIIKGIAKIKGMGMPFHGFFKFLFVAYLLVCVVMVVRGYMIDYNYQWISLQGFLNFHLVSPYYILPYLMPLVAFIPLRYYDFRPLVKCSVVIACLSVVIFVLFFRQISASAFSLATGGDGDYGFGSSFAQIYIPVAFVVLCKKYIPLRTWQVNSLGLLVVLVTFAIAARRGSTVTTACLFLFNLHFYIKSKRGGARVAAIALSILLICWAAYYFMSSDLFSFIHQRGMEDTRSGVDEALLSQMSGTELVFGKGLNGRYYYLLSLDDYLDGWRYGSETGFFNIVLKGGYLMAILYVVLLAYPALLGIVKSNNTLCKALGFYIMLSLVKLYPFGWLAFNMEFLVIWMGVALCYNPSIRNMSDGEVYSRFFAMCKNR